MDGFQFNGAQRTANALHREYPALSKGRWQSVLERGCKTLADAMDESARMDNEGMRNRVFGGRKAAKSKKSRMVAVGVLDCGRYGLLCRSQIQRIAGISSAGLSHRIKSGWTGERLCSQSSHRNGA